MVEEGKPAPDFELESDTGETVKLSDLRGQPVVLYFYPKDETIAGGRRLDERLSRQPARGRASGRQPGEARAIGAGHRPGHLEGAPTVYVRFTQDASAGGSVCQIQRGR